MHPIFEKLCETLSGDAMAKAAVEREWAEKQALVFTPFTDADAERLVGLLNGEEK